MCNNNGHCRKFDAGTMCPSFRATRNERDLTRGRANTLRLALSGQLGSEGEGAVKDALDLCVSCKGCKRECPTGVDMARMKIEFMAHYKARHGHSLRDRAIAFLPKYAPLAARLAPLANGVTAMLQRPLGFGRALPRWRRDWFRDTGSAAGEVILFVDTFNRYFEPENARAAMNVLTAAGYRVQAPAGLCCGRTFLSAGMVDRAKREARRMLKVLGSAAARGVPVVGLEPSCLFSLRDEYGVLLEGSQALARNSFLFEEFLAERPGRLAFAEARREVLLHGHCHQKAFDAMPAVNKVLGMVPGLSVKTVETSCCGMAGSFGYEAEHVEVSKAMAETALLPAVRNAPSATVVADGTSCRHQIADGTGREAIHVARLLESLLNPQASSPPKP
jgi:Fe-S oxidoreductase